MQNAGQVIGLSLDGDPFEGTVVTEARRGWRFRERSQLEQYATRTRVVAAPWWPFSDGTPTVRRLQLPQQLTTAPHSTSPGRS